jgi:hypothetical protein
MRRRLALTALAVSLFALSCTQDQQEGPTEPGSTAAASKSPCPSIDLIQSQICALFPPTDLLKSASDFYNNIQTKKQQNKTTEARARAFDLIDFTLKNLAAGKLLDPNGSSDPTRAAAVAKLTCDVLAYVSLTCGGLSADALGSNGTAQVVGPAGGLVLTPDKHAGVSIPAGAMPSAGLITIEPIDAHTFAPRDGPLPTDLDQYLLFRDYTLSASFTEFTKPVTVAICHLSVGDGDYAPPSETVDARLQLAHPHPNNPGTIELLARVHAPFIECGDFTSSSAEVPPDPDIILLMRPTLGSLASRGGTLLRKAVTPIFSALLPEPAEAAVLGSCCLGGTTSKFSPWAAVDPASGTSTATSLTSASPLGVVGAPLTLTATVSPVPRAPEGPVVEFFDGSTSLGTAPVNTSGVATLATSTLSLAQHSLTAQFTGTTSHLASTSSAITQNMVQRFSTLASFTAALGTSTTATQDFSDFANGPFSGPSLIPGVDVAHSFESLEIRDAEKFLFGLGVTVRQAGDGHYDFTFAEPLTARGMAFDLIAQNPATGPALVVVTAGGGSASLPVSNPNSEDTPNFIGMIASVEIASVVVNEGPEIGGSGNEEIGLDNFVVAQIPSFSD